MQEADKREQRELISILIKGRGLGGGGPTGGLSLWLDQGVPLVLTETYGKKQHRMPETETTLTCRAL